MLAKHPKIFGKIIEIKDEEEITKRDNKSISFHDYLIKKRNSLAEEDQIENSLVQNKEQIGLNKNNNCNQEYFESNDYFNLLTKKNSQNKMLPINFKNTTSIHSPHSILSRKISLPNEIFKDKEENLDNAYNDNITVKNKNNLNLPFQSYFSNNTNNNKTECNRKGGNLKGLSQKEKNPLSMKKDSNFLQSQIKTPQHNYDKKNCYPIKKVINLNLDDSYFQTHEKNFSNQNSSRIDSPVTITEQSMIIKDPYPQKDIAPSFSVSPKYIVKDLSLFKQQNKENLSILANQSKYAIKTEITQESLDHDISFHDINISFDLISKKKAEPIASTKIKETTKRSISMHISSKEALNNLINPNQKFTNFSDFLQKKHNENIHEQSFVSFLEKQKNQETNFKEDKKLNFKNPHDFRLKKESIKKMLCKVYGEKKINEILHKMNNFHTKKNTETHEFLNHLARENSEDILNILKDISPKKSHFLPPPVFLE